MKIAKRMTDSSIATRERFAHGLRLFVGKGRMYSVATLAAATGVAETTVRMATRTDEQGGPPSFDKVLRLIAVLPAAFANHVLEPTGKGGVREPDPLPLDGFRLQASLARRVAVLAEQLADGQQDHRERKQFKRESLELMADLNAFIAAVEDQ